jgi:hypothetical protein
MHRRTIFTLCFACVLPAPAIAAPPAQEFIQVRGNQLLYKGKPVRLKGTSYYPRDYMWAAMWDADAQVFARDAVMISKLGLNCVRILVPYQNGGWRGPNPPADRIAKLVQVVNTFGNRGVRSVVTLFDWETSFAEPGSKREAEHLKHLTVIVARLRDNPYVLMWDVKNEPDHPDNLDKKSDDWDCCADKKAKILD